MTSLIDVIFLLLLFFMLSSTFSRYAELDLAAAGQGASRDSAPARPVFLRLGPGTLSLNGQETELAGLLPALDALRNDTGSTPVLISLRDGVSAQRLTDLLVALSGASHVRATVLGAS